jgi:hypothetical protein
MRSGISKIRRFTGDVNGKSTAGRDIRPHKKPNRDRQEAQRVRRAPPKRIRNWPAPRSVLREFLRSASPTAENFAHLG